MGSSRSNLRQFSRELQRRRVPRAAAWYAGAAFVVLQAADIVLPALGASEWVMSALVVATLLGLPVALALAWAFDLGPDGVQREAPPGPDAPVSADAAGAAGADGAAGAGADGAAGAAGAAGARSVSGGGSIWARAAIAGVVVLAMAGSAWVLYRRAMAPVTAEAVAVMPFTIRGSGHAYLREGMVELLGRSLDGAGSVRTIDPATVLLTVEREHRSGVVDAASGRRLARSLGAGWFVTGAVVEAGPRIRVQAALHRQSAEEGAPAEHAAQVEGPADSVFALVDRIAGELLVSRGGRQGRRLAEAAAVTTGSLEALKRYLSAEEHLRAARHDSALVEYRRATEADSTFALAYYRMAVAGSWAAAAPALVDSALARARAVESRMAPRDRRLLDAFVAFHRGRAKEAEAAYRALLRDYPDDLEATFQLADVLYHYSRVLGTPRTEAYALFNKVLELDPQFLCPI